MIGTLACRLALVRDDDAAAFGPALHRMLAGALALATLASLGILLARTLEMNGGMWRTLPSDLPAVLSATHFGHVWRWRIPALLLAWLAWTWAARRPRRARAAGWIALAAAAAIALTRSDTGHPADHGGLALAVWIDWLHLLAAATWVGSLFGMAGVVYPALLRAPARAATASARIFQRLSTLSGTALGVLLACGIYNVWQQLGPVSSLWLSRYGLTLDAKLALVAAMILIGAHNRYVKLPALRRRAGEAPRTSMFGRPFARWSQRFGSARNDAALVRACVRAVLAECLLGLAVIGATAMLIHAMPPADMAAMPDAMSSTGVPPTGLPGGG